MLPFTTLGLVAFLLSGPEHQSFAAPAAELGGRAVAPHVALPLPSPVPITINLYDGPLRVASAQADLFGRYRIAAPPGDYWLQVNLGAEEAKVERVLLRAGSWSWDLDVSSWLPWSVAPPPGAVASVCREQPSAPPVTSRSAGNASLCSDVHAANEVIELPAITITARPKRLSEKG